MDIEKLEHELLQIQSTRKDDKIQGVEELKIT